MLQNLKNPPTPPDFPGRSKYFIQAWYVISATLFTLSPHFMYGFRRQLLRLFGAKVGAGVKIRPSAKITYPWNVSFGDHCYIGDEAVIYSLDKVKLGEHVSISYRSFLCTGSHDFRQPDFPMVNRPISIESEVWVAADVFIAPGVTIGKGAVILARSTVTKSVEPGVVTYQQPEPKTFPRTPQI